MYIRSLKSYSINSHQLIYLCSHVCTYAFPCVYVHMYVCLYLCVRAFVYIHACLCVSPRVFKPQRTRTHTRTHTYPQVKKKKKKKKLSKELTGVVRAKALRCNQPSRLNVQKVKSDFWKSFSVSQ